MVRVCPCRRHHRHRCDLVKLFSFLIAAISGFTLLELFYTEITPIRKYVTPKELYVSNAQKNRHRLPQRSWNIPTTVAPFWLIPKTPDPTPPEITFAEDNAHGVQGIYVENEYHLQNKKVLSAAIGCAITCKKLKQLDSSNIGQKAPIIRTLLSSFCKTASVGYEYHFYLSYDHDDPYFMQTGAIDKFIRTFMNTANTLCVPEILIKLHLMKVMYHSRPAWAQNDAMMEAYLDGVDYMYR